MRRADALQHAGMQMSTRSMRIQHTVFKSALTIAVDAVVHGMADVQDPRRLDGLVNFPSFTYTAILIGALSLMACMPIPQRVPQ
jgi:NADH:ubiquinone oxidoreductase subunit 5 (subunit L)/multisubunit Na+/H+ antiporter MnhA subunit